MIAILDVQYTGNRARAGCVVARGWDNAAPVSEHAITTDVVADYVPGELYRRELPPLLEVLRGIDDIAIIVVDAHVWLDHGRPGLGAHLHDACGGDVHVVGIAKNEFVGAPALPVIRNQTKPLYVSAIGIGREDAAAHVAAMHGPYRIPTLVRRADQLARGR